ncbi:MAG: hypothetical protein LAN61_02260 [Acidobacteriia bacterium]|nr:hypothetical protein [Terriglobia bacterium]
MQDVLDNWKMLLAAAGLCVTGIAAVSYAFLRPQTNPGETERKRRLLLNQIGRIAEGHVVELVEQDGEPATPGGGMFRGKDRTPAAPAGRKLIWYSYAISGVTYQTAQDVTGLDSQVSFERLVAGQPASIKYDPANPTDSIIAADDWSGLR